MAEQATNDKKTGSKSKAKSKPSANGRKLKGFQREELHGMLRMMLLGRRFEEKAAEAYALGKIGGFCHLYIGQEAVSTGTISTLRDDDYVMTTYRDHGQALARGMTPRSIMAELFGKIDGCSRGKGGSMHLFDRNVNFLGGHGIVGGHVPLATGVAFAIKYRGGDQVCICFMGESVVNTGAFHEALNFSVVWKLPVVFVCENNLYMEYTPISAVTSVEHPAADRASAHGLERIVIDGNDADAVYDIEATAFRKFFALPGDGWKWHFDVPDFRVRFVALRPVEKRQRPAEPLQDDLG